MGENKSRASETTGFFINDFKFLFIPKWKISSSLCETTLFESLVKYSRKKATFRGEEEKKILLTRF